ncbi:MAG TPA: GAF domain-containing SpoIIE family protein phosphatase [Pseudonocardiaceae bacterium]|nr:GAF domain-containing SpoIIE family protein phosphatase [Pseudonocardiaceae bacterium]
MADRESAEDRLRKIMAVTDSSLAQLDTQALLDELLGRVRHLLEVDTATVLLVDSSGQLLNAVAAIGIEEEVRQGVQVPVGRGFAGWIAAHRLPLVIDHVDEATVLNPLLWERGLRTLLGVPLVAKGRLLGVLHIGATRSRSFTDDDVQLLHMVADRLALVADSRLSVTERSAVTALQRSLLPSVLPDMPGLDFAARYVPGTDSGVGGDWYDVFPLSGGSVGVVMGDVVGNGLAAAVVMGRLRSALRAYALDVEDPAEVLRKLDRKAAHFEPGTMATVAYGVVDRARERLVIASAGHLPPLLIEPGADAVFTQPRIGPPVGFSNTGAVYQACPVHLRPGALVCLYTDGLVERRDSTIDEGLERLRTAVHIASPEMVCARVMAAMVGTQAVPDDIAVLVMRRDPAVDPAG